MTKSKDLESKLLTEVELELMTILWRQSEGTVADVIKELPQGRDLAYTSVSTILRILEQKKILTTRKEGRGHVYIPALTKVEYETRTVKHMVERVFDGTPMALAKQLLNSSNLTREDLQQLKEMILQAEKKS